MQNWSTFAVLALTIGFVSAGISHGSTANLQPLFNGPALVSVVLMLQVVPYFMTGFESIGKASEEASTEFQPRRFMLAILLAIVVGALFYAIVTTAVAYVAPWQSLVHERFATAVAFEHAMGSQLIVKVIMATALLSLLKIFNGNFIAASRCCSASDAADSPTTRLGYVHPLNRTPSVAVVCLGVATALLMFAGEVDPGADHRSRFAGLAARLDGLVRRLLAHAPFVTWARLPPPRASWSPRCCC